MLWRPQQDFYPRPAATLVLDNSAKSATVSLTTDWTWPDRQKEMGWSQTDTQRGRLVAEVVGPSGVTASLAISESLAPLVDECRHTGGIDQAPEDYAPLSRATPPESGYVVSLETQHIPSRGSDRDTLVCIMKQDAFFVSAPPMRTFVSPSIAIEFLKASPPIDARVRRDPPRLQSQLAPVQIPGQLRGCSVMPDYGNPEQCAVEIYFGPIYRGGTLEEYFGQSFSQVEQSNREAQFLYAGAALGVGLASLSGILVWFEHRLRDRRRAPATIKVRKGATSLESAPLYQKSRQSLVLNATFVLTLIAIRRIWKWLQRP